MEEARAELASTMWLHDIDRFESTLLSKKNVFFSSQASVYILIVLIASREKHLARSASNG